MWSSSVSRIAEPAAVLSRRRLLRALMAAPLLGAFRSVRAEAPPLAGLRRWGRGEFRRFGVLVYEATLWAGDDPRRPPLALRLDYKFGIRGAAIADASVKEMRRFVSDETRLKEWGERMARIFPDVKAGDHLLGVHRPHGAWFYQGERLLGVVEAPGFADAFFGIWLDEGTSAPSLRAALLQGG